MPALVYKPARRGSATTSSLPAPTTIRQQKLKVRYDVIDKNIVRGTVTSQSGEPVDKIIFHRVSEP